MLVCNNISRSYGNRKALDGFSADTKKARVVALLGPNGAGKSTLAEILVGLKKADSGEFSINVKNMNKAMQFQNAPVFQALSLFDNFVLFCTLYEVDSSSNRIEAILEDYGLIEQKNILAKNLSNGQKQTLSIALSLIASPNFIILDEPMNNLDPLARVKMRNRILQLKRQGIYILLISHDLAEISRMADYYLFIGQGRNLAAGSMKEICKTYEVTSIEDAYSRIYQ